MKVLSFLVCFVISIGMLFSQTSYRFNNYSINEGLSQSVVNCILQDNSNALWVGTQEGLNRFDGKTFDIYNSDNTEGIESENVRCSAKTADGNLWFGTTNGLVKYDFKKETFKTIDFQKNIPLQIENISIDIEGNLWLSSLTSGLLRLNHQTEKITSYSHLLPSNKVLTLHCEKNGDIFVATEDKGLFHCNVKNKVARRIYIPFKFGETGAISNITSCENQKILICTTKGIYEYSMVTHRISLKFRKLYKEFGTIGVSNILLTKNKNWLIATINNGLFTIKNDGYIFNSSEDIFQKNALLDNKTKAFFEDKQGNYWIGTDRGLCSFNPMVQGFLGVGPTGNLEQGVPTPTIWSFGEDEHSEYVFIGTDRGISRFNRTTRKFEHFYRNAEKTNVSVEECMALSLKVINKNYILVGTSDGLYELKINSKNDYQFKKSKFFNDILTLNHTRIYAILHWKENQYFLGTSSGAVLINLSNKKSTLFEHSFTDKDNTIAAGLCRVVYKDRKGKIWFSTSTGGLNTLVQKDNKLFIKPYKNNSEILKISKDYITSIYERKNDEMWFGTFGSGLFKFNISTKKIETFNKSNGLPNNVIYGILSTDEKNLWFSTNKGICWFNLDTYSIKNYKEVNGLMSNEFNMGSYYKAKNGELYFGGINGYNYFDPKTLVPKKNELEVYFTKLKTEKDWVKINGKGSPLKTSLSLTSRLDLKYSQRNLTFQFLASDLSNPELVNYKYKILGLEEGETYIGNINEISLPSLSPGEYTLTVSARIGEGDWSKKPAIIQINVESPFWWKWWFWVSIAAFLLLLVRLFVRQKVELERRKLVRLEMKIAERTSEIRAKNAQIEEQNNIINKEKEKVIEQKRLLQIEKDKSETLIRKIIPESTVEELKNSGKTSARAYKMVSILFTDFVGFTKIAEKMTPTDLVNKLDVYFRKFDEIIVNNNLEKIKTIGDAYMCAGGVPVRNNTNPIDTCLAALQIQSYMAKLKKEAIATGEEYWSLRLGINTGEVTAGVIGSEKLAYDIWGSAVNRAQRMEMMGEPGKVTITGETYKLIEPYFECVFRGKAKSKNNNEMEMYSVERIKPQLSINGEGVYPNERFQQIVNLYLYSSINYHKAERYITRILQKGLSEKLHYHCIEHVEDVVRAVENLALTEDVTDEGLFLLKSAASYHDAGFVEQYDKNEPIGARMAEEILPKYGYTDQHITIIKELIYVTQIPHKPTNKLEEIMCDADLDYLGRDDFHEIADRLRRELREHGKIDSDRKWDELQVNFLSNHRYFTKTAIETRRPKKLQNLEEIKQRLERNEYID